MVAGAGVGKATGRHFWRLEVDLINKAEAKKQLTQASSSLPSHCHAEVACALTHAWKYTRASIQ